MNIKRQLNKIRKAINALMKKEYPYMDTIDVVFTNIDFDIYEVFISFDIDIYMESKYEDKVREIVHSVSLFLSKKEFKDIHFIVGYVNGYISKSEEDK